MKKLFIIKAGSTFDDTAKRYGDFDEMTCRRLGIERDDIRVVNAFRGEVLQDLRETPEASSILETFANLATKGGCS